MDKTLKVINQMKEDGVIRDYAIGGAIAVLFHTEPFFTEDLDIMFVPVDEEESEIAPLSLIYAYLVEKKKYEIWKGYIMVEGIPVQFIPVSHELEVEALINADETTYEGVKTKVFKPEYMIAIYVLSDRKKDRLKIAMLFEQSKIDESLLEVILRRHNLFEKYVKNRKWYYE